LTGLARSWASPRTANRANTEAPRTKLRSIDRSLRVIDPCSQATGLCSRSVIAPIRRQPIAAHAVAALPRAQSDLALSKSPDAVG